MDRKLAITGGVPAFEHASAKRNYLPDWEAFTGMIDGIFSRKYYTNHGPLARELEKRLSDFFRAKHTVCMTNSGIGTMIAIKALGLKGRIIVPAFSHVSVKNAVAWGGLDAVFCDIDPATFHLDADKAGKVAGNAGAIFGVNLFGGTCDYDALAKIAHAHSLKQLFVSDDAIGERYGKTMIGNFGDLEIFSLHESNLINSTDGCVITTNDDQLAARLRNIRSSYGSGPVVPIEFTGNGRMSEVQAGMALLTMDSFAENAEKNRSIAKRFAGFVNEVKGLTLFEPAAAITERNGKRLIVKVDEAQFGLKASELAQVLRAENITVDLFDDYAKDPNAGCAVIPDMPNTVSVSTSLLEIIPHRELKHEEEHDRIGDVLNNIHAEAERLRSYFRNNN